MTRNRSLPTWVCLALALAGCDLTEEQKQAARGQRTETTFVESLPSSSAGTVRETLDVDPALAIAHGGRAQSVVSGRVRPHLHAQEREGGCDRGAAREWQIAGAATLCAIVRTLPEYTEINVPYDDDAGSLTKFGAVHIGIAAQTPRA